MANTHTEGRSTIDSSSIIEMDVVDDASDYEMNFKEVPSAETSADGTQRRSGDASADSSYVEGVKQQVTQNVTSYIWQSGRQQAKKAFNIYGNIDILRPYFDVEPHEVRTRLMQSLVPSRPGATKQIKVHRELYGPTMLIFTMIALLLFQMKTSGHSVEEGTLMGTAFGVCFGYWFGVSGLMWCLSYICNTHITILQLLSLTGYALFGHCIVVGLTTIVHTTHDHMLFYLMWAIFGGLSTLKMVAVLTSRTTGQTQKLIVCGSIAFLHLCFLLYLHFAYHQIVEDLSEMLDSSIKHVSPAVEHQTKESVHNVVERSVNQVTDALGHDHKGLEHGADTAQKLHQADNMQKVANAVTQKVAQSIQGVVRNVLPTKVPNLAVDEAVKVVKDVASNSSVVKEAVNSAGKIMQNMAENLNKTAMNGNFMQNMAHNLTKTALNRKKFF